MDNGISEFIMNNRQKAEAYAIESQEYLRKNRIPPFKTKGELAQLLSANKLSVDPDTLDRIWIGSQILLTFSNMSPPPQESETPSVPPPRLNFLGLIGTALIPFAFRNQAELVEDDPKFKKIVEQKKEEWLKNNPGKDFSSKEGLDYIYGSLDDPEAPSLRDEAEKEFREKHKKLAERYNRLVKKPYKTPEEDPAIRHTKQQIEEHKHQRKLFFERNGAPDNWEDIQKKIEHREWDRFVNRYPGKARAYQEKSIDINRVLDKQDIRQKLLEYRQSLGREIKFTEKIKRGAPRISVEEATKRLENIAPHIPPQQLYVPHIPTGAPTSTAAPPTRFAPRRRRGLVDAANRLPSMLRSLQRTWQELRIASSVVQTVARGIFSSPYFWVFAVIIFLILFILFLSPGGGFGIPGLGGGGQPGGGLTGPAGGRICSSGSLDYYIPFRDAPVLPQDPDSIKQQVLARWPNAQVQYWDTIVSESQRHGWNPAFVLALWIEETGASHHTKTENGGGGASPLSNGHLGCAPWENQTIDESLSCLFNSFESYNNLEDFMCVYGGDSFQKAPCTFSTANPAFPSNIKDWYSRIVPGGSGALAQASFCSIQPGGWPTKGALTQGPLGSFDHARIKSGTGAEGLDIADPSGPSVYSSFDGVVSAVHDCIIDGDCSRGYGGYGNSLEITSNDGGFTVLYGHLSSFTVNLGGQVKIGDQIGFMGTTGVSTGIHLHWEFRGIKMEPPNIPEPIVPLDCNTPSIPCSPASLSPVGAPI